MQSHRYIRFLSRRFDLAKLTRAPSRSRPWSNSPSLAAQPHELGCRKHWQSLAPVAPGDTWVKSWQKSIGRADFGRVAALELEARSDQGPSGDLNRSWRIPWLACSA